MRTKQVLAFISFLSLLSFIISCEENANVKGYLDGDPNGPFYNSFLKYYIHDDNLENGFSETEFIQTAHLESLANEILITTARNGQKNIKGHGYGITFYQQDEETGWYDDVIGFYYLANYESIDGYVENVIYVGYAGNNRQELEEEAKANIKAFMGQPQGTSSPNEFLDPIFIGGTATIFTGNPADERHYVLSPLRRIGYTSEKNGSILKIRENNVPVFEFIRDTAEVISDQQYSKVDLYLTLWVTGKPIPDY